jgi:hypothetical protein
LNFLSGEPLLVDDRTGVAIPTAGEVGLSALVHFEFDLTLSGSEKRSAFRVGLVDE